MGAFYSRGFRVRQDQHHRLWVELLSLLNSSGFGCISLGRAGGLFPAAPRLLCSCATRAPERVALYLQCSPLAPPPGMEPEAPALEVRSPNPGTTGEPLPPGTF